MGNGMNKVLPGLYIGNFRDSKDREQLTTHGITHILAIHDNAKKLHEDMNYLCIPASDSPHQNLTQHFRKSIKFIHESRLGGGACLIHCLAGVSRSVTVAAAYVMTVTNLGWRDTLKAIRQARAVANPNFGFQRQLQEFDAMRLSEERAWLKQNYPDSPFEADAAAIGQLLQTYVEAHVKNPYCEDDLYPFPHNAYSFKGKPEDEKKEEDKRKEQEDPGPS
ncbi:dual specificity protein phosphatase 22-like isoform X3 [Branchiostoma floridae x Branchiostoma belcheri]|nr:Dual specificity protein phosphatase 22 [Branchiostoma belcheri]